MTFSPRFHLYPRHIFSPEIRLCSCLRSEHRQVKQFCNDWLIYGISVCSTGFIFSGVTIRIDDFHLLQENGPFLLLKTGSAFELQLDIRFLIAEERGHIEAGIAGKGDFVRPAPNLAGEIRQDDMRIRKAGHADIF